MTLTAPDLGQRLHDGEPGALDECYRQMGELVRRAVSRYVSYSEIDDITQRVFYDVWRARERYDPARDLRVWVLAIARKRSIDGLRRRPPSTSPLEYAQNVVGSDGRDEAARHASALAIRAALRRLTHHQRAVIELAYFDGYTQPEIALLLDVPLGTVKSRTARSLTRLGELLASAG